MSMEEVMKIVSVVDLEQFGELLDLCSDYQKDEGK